VLTRKLSFWRASDRSHALRRWHDAKHRGAMGRRGFATGQNLTVATLAPVEHIAGACSANEMKEHPMPDDPSVPLAQLDSDGYAPNLGRAYELLQQLLSENHGATSSIQLKRALITRLAIEEPEARSLMVELQFLDESAAQRIGKTEAKTYHYGRTFYSKDRYEEVLAQTDKEADTKEQEAEGKPDEEEDRETETRQNRQEEARLGAYVKRLLTDIYASDFAPDESEYVFDVHNERPGSTYENVDLIAVHWRTESTGDLVAVEVKLQFTAIAVHQACNYTRFSHRVWVGALVTSDVTEAALELRSVAPGLFDYAVSRGLGIIACRRTQGRGYQVFPIHWPRWQDPEPVERQQFLERYRRVFEQAGVLEPKAKRRLARF
jgi:hypothetical protein